MTIKARLKATYPGRVQGENGITASVSGGVMTVGPNYGSLAADSSISTAQLATVSFPYYDSAGSPTYGRVTAQTIVDMVTENGAFADDVFTLEDDGDATKQVQFQLSGITTGTLRTITFPDASFTLVGADTTQTLSAKTLTAPTINGGTHTGITLFGIASTGSGAFDLQVANTENLTAARTLTFDVNNANRTIDLAGDLTFAGAFTVSNSLTFAGTNGTTMTFPSTSATIARTDAGQTFTGTNAFGKITFAATTITDLTDKASPDPDDDYVIIYDLAGTAVKKATVGSVSSAGSGDVVGPASATDNAAARFDTTTGKLIQDSALIIADTTGSLSRSGNGGIPVQGTNTNDAAAAGYVGEYVSVSLDAGSATAVGTGTTGNVTSIELTAGDWDVGCVLVTNVNSAGTMSAWTAGWNTTTGTLPDNGAGRSATFNVDVTEAVNITIPATRLSLSGTTTVYAVSAATFSGDFRIYGTLFARRVR